MYALVILYKEFFIVRQQGGECVEEECHIEDSNVSDITQTHTNKNDSLVKLLYMVLRSWSCAHEKPS